MAFRARMKVVCVDAAPEKGSWGPSDAPVEGAIYTVHAVIVVEDGVQLQLQEIKRSDVAVRMYGPQIGYWAHRFRPLQYRKRKTSIKIFEKIADEARKRIRSREPA